MSRDSVTLPVGLSQEGNTNKDVIRLLLMAAAAFSSWIGFWRYIAPFDLIAVVASLVGGYPVFVETFRSLRHRHINMEVSMTIAIFATLLTGQSLPAVVITFFVLLSEYIETFAVDRGRATVAKLEQSIPRMALVRRDGTETEVGISSIRPGETVIVRHGERIPVDGVVVSGSGLVNQATITGEAMRVDKTVGSDVYAGTINETGSFEVMTSKVGKETVFGQIIRLVEEAESKKAPIQKISDKLATWLVEFTLAFTVITFIVTQNLTSTISVVVVAGACGVAAGTPLAIVATMGGLAKKGVIVKGGPHIQEMSKVDTVVIDKTGTLTFGEPEVTDVVALDGHSEGEVLSYAALAERLSSHPLAKAILGRASATGLVPQASASDYIAGKGMVALQNGEEVAVGNASLMQERHVELPEDVVTVLSGKVSEGKTAVMVAHNGTVCGVIAFSDKIRDESRKSIEALERIGISTVMLTGDNKEAAKAVGDVVGIDHVYSELLPQEKVSVVERLLANGHRIAMVGDGVNDAPALARANVGIGMGAGTDFAIEEADVVLMTNDLSKIPILISASRRAFRTIMGNFYGTLVVDAVGVSLAFFGAINPLIAAGIHVGSELVFILNSARLVR
jgi:Cd2+/Zn2+-exporting ATPase/Cu+-exporting ATPase